MVVWSVTLSVFVTTIMLRLFAVMLSGERWLLRAVCWRYLLRCRPSPGVAKRVITRMRWTAVSKSGALSIDRTGFPRCNRDHSVLLQVARSL